MTIQDFSFPAEWFEDEVREGVFVPATMKRNWAGQLMVLREIDRVCKELNLTWYLDSGGLLGAIRHKGFIPWDDDIDITMFRKDIEIFRKKAKPLLPEGYFIVDPRDEAGVNSDVFRIVATTSINLDAAYVDTYYCPFVLGIDVLSLENYLEDEEYENHRTELMTSLKVCFEYLQNKEDPENPKFKELMEYCEQETGVEIMAQENPLHALSEQLVILYNQVADDTTKTVKMFFGRRSHLFDREWFGTPQMLMFEGISLPAPRESEKVLFSEYGNSRYIGRTGGAHDYPCYKEQERIFREDLGHNPYRYTYKPEDLPNPKIESPQEMIQKLLSMFEKLLASLKLCESDESKRIQVLMGMQKILVSMTDILTPMFPGCGENMAEALKALGESIFRVFSEWTPGSTDELKGVFDTADSEVKTALSERKVIVFLPCRAAWWTAMEKMWKYAKGLSEAKVIVSPIPWYEEPVVGERGNRHDETDLFPEDVELIPRAELNLQALHPEAVIIQVPYDNQGVFMLIDDENCSNHLRNETDQLIYIPCFEPDTPGEEDQIAVKALENLIEQPAVINADEVRVPTSRMREIYVDTLTELSGEEKRAYWEKKIKAEDSMEISTRDTVFTGNKVFLHQ